MKKNHNFFSNLAFNIAEINLGKTKSNPSVGCIITKNNTVLSTGVTSVKGRPHAEHNALNSKCNFSGSSMYLTLEPCTHYGITEPCTNIIKRKKIKSVYYCFNDPDIRTYKKASPELNKNKIFSKKIKHNFKDFYNSYFIKRKKNFPLIDAKIAVSKEFKTINKKSKWITNCRSRKVGHLIRSRYDSIISTSKSINKDNSLLNCRIDGLKKYSPDIIIIDINLKIKKNLKIFNLEKKRKIYLFTSKYNKNKFDFLKRKKVKIISIKSLYTKNEFIYLFKKISQFGKSRILVEAGLTFMSSLIKFKLINNLFLFKSNKKLGNKGYNNIKYNIFKNFKLKEKVKVNLYEDELYHIKVK